MANSPSRSSSTTLQGKPRVRKPFHRQALNCLPCRQRKLKCDRQMPCSSCMRSKREDECRQNPPAATSPVNARGGHPNEKFTAASAASLPSPSSADFMLMPNAEGEHGDEAGVESQAGTEQPLSAADTVALQPSFTLPASESVSNLSMEASYSELHASRHDKAGMLPLATPRSNDMLGFSVDAVEAETAPSELLPSSTLMKLFPAPGIQGPRLQKVFWKRQLCHMLPSRNQCDVLLSYYLENLQWMFQSVHEPTVRDQYADFWRSKTEDIDLAWLSLLFAMLASAALYIPIAVAESVGISASKVREQAHVWHYGSQQALCVGGNESKPCFVQLQTFNVSVLYWYATKEVDALNL